MEHSDSNFLPFHGVEDNENGNDQYLDGWPASSVISVRVTVPWSSKGTDCPLGLLQQSFISTLVPNVLMSPVFSHCQVRRHRRSCRLRKEEMSKREDKVVLCGEQQQQQMKEKMKK